MQKQYYRISQIDQIRLKIHTNKGVNFITSLRDDCQVFDLANKALNVYLQLTCMGNGINNRKQLTVASVMQGDFHLPKSEYIANLLQKDDKILINLVKAKPKYPNMKQKQYYNSVQLLQQCKQQIQISQQIPKSNEQMKRKIKKERRKSRKSRKKQQYQLKQKQNINSENINLENINQQDINQQNINQQNDINKNKQKSKQKSIQINLKKQLQLNEQEQVELLNKKKEIEINEQQCEQKQQKHVQDQGNQPINNEFNVKKNKKIQKKRKKQKKKQSNAQYLHNNNNNNTSNNKNSQIQSPRITFHTPKMSPKQLSNQSLKNIIRNRTQSKELLEINNGQIPILQLEKQKPLIQFKLPQQHKQIQECKQIEQQFQINECSDESKIINEQTPQQKIPIKHPNLMINNPQYAEQIRKMQIIIDEYVLLSD